MAHTTATQGEIFVLQGWGDYVAAILEGSKVRHLGEVRETQEEALSDAQQALEQVAT